jgi:GTP cyclohydrolase II
LGLAATAAAVVTVAARDALTAALVNVLADPLAEVPDRAVHGLATEDAAPFSCETAAVELAKLARLLPAAASPGLAPTTLRRSCPSRPSA